MCEKINMNTNLKSFSVGLFLLAVVGLSDAVHVSGQQKKLKISTYYETRCPDSVRFIKNQLYPVYSQLTDYVELDLIPYGVASTVSHPNGSFSFQCQHGPPECHGNKIHGCAILKLLPDVSAAFVNCSMSSKDPELAGPDCSRLLRIDWTPIETCANGAEGSAILNQMGIRTTALKPPAYWIPWIVYDGVFYEEELDASQQNLLPVVCRHIVGEKPAICNQYYTRQNHYNQQQPQRYY